MSDNHWSTVSFRNIQNVSKHNIIDSESEALETILPSLIKLPSKIVLSSQRSDFDSKKTEIIQWSEKSWSSDYESALKEIGTNLNVTLSYPFYDYDSKVEAIESMRRRLQAQSQIKVQEDQIITAIEELCINALKLADKDSSLHCHLLMVLNDEFVRILTVDPLGKLDLEKMLIALSDTYSENKSSVEEAESLGIGSRLILDTSSDLIALVKKGSWTLVGFEVPLAKNVKDLMSLPKNFIGIEF